MLKNNRKWLPVEIEEIKRLYPVSSTKDLAARYRVKPKQLAAVAHYYGVKKQQRHEQDHLCNTGGGPIETSRRSNLEAVTRWDYQAIAERNRSREAVQVESDPGGI